MDFKTVTSKFFRSIGKAIPAKKKEAKRRRSGGDFNKSRSLVLLCKDTNEEQLKKRKKFIKHVKGEYGLRNVMIYCYTESETNETPVYLGHLKELDFFSLGDLNWRWIPKSVLNGFCKENYDLLIDLTAENSEPLEHVISASQAKMKVGRKGSVHEKYLDLIVDIPESKTEEEFLKHTEQYLSKFNFS